MNYLRNFTFPRIWWSGFVAITVSLAAASTPLFSQPLISLSLEHRDEMLRSRAPDIWNANGLPPLPNDYSQDFDAYAGTPATIPFGWTVSFSGNAVFNGTGAGTSATGGAWAYGTGSDFSFGALRTATPGNLTLAVALVNDTGATITDLTIQWNYEQWRYANISGFDLSGTGTLAGNVTVNAADFAGSASGTSGTPTATPISLTLSGLSIAPDATFGLSWVTTDASGSDNGIGIDDFAISAGSPVPELSTIPMVILGGGLLIGMRRFLRKVS